MTKVSCRCFLIVVCLSLWDLCEAQTADSTRVDFLLDTGQVIEGTLSPDEYIVGPGDRFLITIWGKRPEHFQSIITPEGKLLIPQITEIQVDGLTISGLRERLAEEMTKYFFDIRVDATLVKLRRFQVYVLGDVKRPGGYPAQAVDRVSRLIAASGGLLENASSRSIEILRDGMLADEADLVRFVVEGSLENNPFVRDGDIIFVPPQISSVTVYGRVRSPGTYELRDGDTLESMVQLAKGLRPEALLSDVELIRFNGDNITTSTRILDLRNASSTDWQMRLEPDDRIFVRAIPDWHESHSVTISGEVRFPGKYVIEKDSTTLTFVVELAGGFTEDASLFQSYVTRSSSNMTLDREFERLNKMPVTDMIPTEYEYFKMKSRTRPGVMVVDFQRLFENGDQTEELLLENGDNIVIARNQETVVVTGQVAVPGAIMHGVDLSVDDYIERAGGYAWNARKDKTRVIRAKTGEWLWADRVSDLGPGDTIWVPEKPYRDWWSIFLQGMTTAGQVATVLLLINNIGS